MENKESQIITVEAGQEQPAHISEEEANLLEKLEPGSKFLLNQEYKGSKSPRNTVYCVGIENDGLGIFKPKSGERAARIEVREGTYYKRERAAYLVDRFLGFNLVPPTVIREVDGEEGSFQQFISDAEINEKLKTELRTPDKQLQEELVKLWVYDYVIFNSDRHWGNLLMANKKLHAIDNSLTFGPDRLRRAYGRDENGEDRNFFDVPVSESVKEIFTSYFSDKTKRQDLKKLLGGLLSPSEVGACLARIKKIGTMILDEGKIPKESEKQLTFFPS